MKPNKRDKKQLEIWNNIYQYMSASIQMQDDYLQIDKDREAFHKEQHDREKWLLDNWQVVRPNRSTRNRRVKINIFQKF